MWRSGPPPPCAAPRKWSIDDSSPGIRPSIDERSRRWIDRWIFEQHFAHTKSKTKGQTRSNDCMKRLVSALLVSLAQLKGFSVDRSWRNSFSTPFTSSTRDGAAGTQEASSSSDMSKPTNNCDPSPSESAADPAALDEYSRLTTTNNRLEEHWGACVIDMVLTAPGSILNPSSLKALQSRRSKLPTEHPCMPISVKVETGRWVI